MLASNHNKSLRQITLFSETDTYRKIVFVNDAFCEIAKYKRKNYSIVKHATFEYGQLSPLNATPVLMYQLFYNLVSNSLKFSRQDVKPVIRISTQMISLPDPKSQGVQRPFTRIILKDNGIGFPNSHAEEIFKTFVRLNSKDRYEGTGLGLELCRKIVERHGGTIMAEGFENKGAQFTMDLPWQPL